MGFRLAKNVVCTNRKAYYDYAIEETYEAGLVLTGTEVKSLRGHRANLKDSYAIIKDSELYLIGMHISPYPFGNIFNPNPLRTRKLLLHKAEIKRLIGKVKEKGYALVPLKVYFRRGVAKVELGLGKGKRLYDKRREIAKKEAEREIERELKERQQTSGKWKVKRKIVCVTLILKI